MRSIRRVRATSETCVDALLERYSDPDELARSLIDGDPEIDLEMTGRTTGSCDRVHIDSDGQILYAPSVVEVRYGPDGMEQERRPLTVRPSNLVTPTPPVWSGILLPRSEVIMRYALTRAYQVMHTNALEFDFLYSIDILMREDPWRKSARADAVMAHSFLNETAQSIAGSWMEESKVTQCDSFCILLRSNLLPRRNSCE